ncbi:MAG: hypothetical protein P4L99_11925 [Chthoniobacter sp.]|nr:hypothetical protein [Chthoniobacter sp.]
MTTDRHLDPLFRTIALVLVTAAVAALVHRFDATLLAKIDSMSPAAYVEHARHLHQHSYLFHFLTFLVGGGFYVGAIELIVYLLRLSVPTSRPVD